MKTKELRTHLIINLILILYNVFGEAATPMLFYKLEREYWPLLKTFLLFLSLYPIGLMPELDTEDEIQEELDKI